MIWLAPHVATPNAGSMNKAGVGMHHKLTIDERAYQRAWPPFEQKKKTQTNAG
jgi:hypothetical protein